ncbi:MAG: hypothetical protein ACRCW3_03855, partial [Metamycoplasmataceae bacterium]
SQEEPYIIEKNAKLMHNYNIWIDNENYKKVNTSDFENYGYFLICENYNEEKIQYLDSTPELQFFNEFKSRISKDQMKEINFFAKMPTLGSGVYFEYYSKKEASIKKSFMDFAIEYRNRIIMVEVKSKDADYDSQKTNELLEAYEIYMKKYNKENLSLVLYEYDKNDKTQGLYIWIKNKWEKNVSFSNALKEILR